MRTPNNSPSRKIIFTVSRLLYNFIQHRLTPLIMRSTPLRKYLVALVLFLFLASSLAAQKRTEKKYPALLWEITGNGLTKPSYLFGTMHVSSKLVFHLSDSFYNAIKNTDAVALELNPDVWQGPMVRLNTLK